MREERRAREERVAAERKRRGRRREGVGERTGKRDSRPARRRKPRPATEKVKRPNIIALSPDRS